MRTFWQCFVPLFVAVDAIGVLPIYLGLTQGFSREQHRRVILQSMLTATVVALAFLAAGPAVLRFLRITVPDFMVAGGTLLFVIAMNDILRSEKAHRTVDSETVGAVPIGVPLITGPAVLTTVLLLTAEHHYVITGPAILLNVLFAGLVFGFAEPIHDFLGKAGTKTISKIAHLLLAAIAVMMVRKGLAQIIATGGFM